MKERQPLSNSVRFIIRHYICFLLRIDLNHNDSQNQTQSTGYFAI